MPHAHLVIVLASNLFPLLIFRGRVHLGWFILLFYIWQRHLFKPIKLQKKKHTKPVLS